MKAFDRRENCSLCQINLCYTRVFCYGGICVLGDAFLFYNELYYAMNVIVDMLEDVC